MQKIPTIFIRDKENPKRVTSIVDADCQWVFDGEGVPTIKYDGTCCAVIGGRLYKRHQHKADKGDPPGGWVHWSLDSAQRSGHGWLPCIDGDSSARWHLEAWRFHRVGLAELPPDGTYELVGPKVQKNPYRLDQHELWRHGDVSVGPLDEVTPDWLAGFFDEPEHSMEGIVWHHPDGRMAKIKSRDFGVQWPK